MSLWIFGYGSLIWRPGFDYLERRRARLHGWQRRFWQGSHDHRGVPEQPGRVVTLVETGTGHCDGMAYRVDADTVSRVFENLDHREKNGYVRREVILQSLVGAAFWPRLANTDHRGQEAALMEVHSKPRRSPAPNFLRRLRRRPGTLRAPTPVNHATLPAVVYVAPTDNFAYLGPAPLPEMVHQIATSHGPSGTNVDYLFELAAALRSIDAHDPHVFELEAAVRTHAP